MRKFRCLNIVIIGLIVSLQPLFCFSQSKERARMSIKAEDNLKKLDNLVPEWRHLGRIHADSVSVLPEKKLVQIFFTTPLSYIPVREDEIEKIENLLKRSLGRKFRNYNIELFTDHHLLKELVPNGLRTTIPIDKNRISGNKTERIPVVSQMGKDKPLFGLYNNNIALWDSHGWYYESKLDRWEWQRARLFGTVEDMSTMSYVLPYLVPMLENSGAGVFLARERDWQANEVIVDNDKSSTGSEMVIPQGVQPEKIPEGFLMKDTLVSGENPFEMGTSFRYNDLNNKDIAYIPFFDTGGRYSVSVSYQTNESSSSQVKYSVYHSGGKTDYFVNQRIGGGTWIYLGTFDFKAGKNLQIGMVKIGSSTINGGSVSVDAIKFGGGKGNIARKPTDEVVQNKKSLSEGPGSVITAEKVNPGLFNLKLSHKPRYLEASRYYLQFAGFPDTLTYSLNKDKNDYNDDYQSRGEWVNYLMGQPNGPVNHRNITGLQIPVDMAFAFHTDAGVTPGDSIIGFFNPGKGIVVHHYDCRNKNVVRKKQTSWLDVEWSQETVGEFPAELRLEVLNQRGSLATVASTISELNSNIENVTVVEQDSRICVDLITISVKDRVHLAKVMRRLKELSIVVKITRVKA